MSGKRDPNPRPSAWEANALPTELFPLIIYASKFCVSVEKYKSNAIFYFA